LLRDKFGTADFTKWGKYSKFDERLVDELCKDNADEINHFLYAEEVAGAEILVGAD
jgi:hypothetical protein